MSGEARAASATAAPWTEHSARVGEITLRYLSAGDGPLVLLLHGFPDSAHGWRFQLPALAAAGYRAVAPQLRGYDGSDRPAGVEAYDIDELVGDVAGLMPALGAERAAMIVGHDWGGLIAWHLASRRPQLLERLAVINAPHPAAFARELRSVEQLLRSSYALAFQLPVLPELALRTGGYWLLRRGVERNVHRRAALTAADWERQRAALEMPGALTAALNYYRAAGRRLLRERTGSTGRFPIIQTPTLVLWGERDPFLRTRLTDGLERWAPRHSVTRLPRAGHWAHWDEDELVNGFLLDWLLVPPAAS